MIARHYPPEPSGGARRPYLFVKALRAQGHRVTLVTPFTQEDDDAITVPHPANIDLTQADKTSAAKPSIATRLKDWLRLWLLWPEPDIRWAKRASAAIRARAAQGDWDAPDILFTTHPPESLHVVGAKLARDLRLPWAAEMRDTWIDVPHRDLLIHSKLRAFFEARMARKCLSKADGITAVSEAVMAEGRRYMNPEARELILGHFSAPSDEALELDEREVHLVHAGGFTLSDRRRPLGPLLSVIERAAQSRGDLHLHIAGRLSDEERALMSDAKGFKITDHGLVPLERSRALQNAADGLILYTPPDSHALPGKFAEYRFAQRPILYFGGGSWTSLVDDPSVLRPLEAGLQTLKKRENVSGEAPLNADTAARRLVHFLDGLIAKP